MKVLIGSCGGLTGLYLTKKFKNDFYIPIDVYGFDCNRQNPTRFFLDEFFISPRIMEEKNFISFLLDILNNNCIDFYIPTYSKEIEIISKNEQYVRKNSKTKFIISEFKTIQALEDKKNAYENLFKLGINVPKLYYEDDEISFPVYSKPRTGSGSKRNAIVYNYKQMKDLKDIEEDLIFMELLKGREYTVDAIFDDKCNLVAYNQRVREKTLGGAVIVTRNNFDIDCKHYIIKIGTEYKIKGVCNFQFFLTERGIYFTDINLRFASGGLPLSVKSGVDVPEILIKMLSGEDVLNKYFSDRKNRIMYRYFDEVFEEEEVK